MSAAAAAWAFAGRSFPGRLFNAYWSSGASQYAAALAFRAFLTMFPIVLGAFSVFGILLRGHAFYVTAEKVLLNAFPVDMQRELERTLTGAQVHATTIGIVSLVTFTWSVTGLFASLEFALDHLHGVSGRDALRQRLHGLRLGGVFVLGIVGAVAINSLIGLLGAPALADYLEIVGGWLVVTAMLAWIYRVAPNERLGWRQGLPGAAVAAALIELLTLGFPLIEHLQLSTYTKGFALIFALCTWIYLVCQLLLLGAIMNRLLAEPEAAA